MPHRVFIDYFKSIYRWEWEGMAIGNVKNKNGARYCNENGNQNVDNFTSNGSAREL